MKFIDAVVSREHYFAIGVEELSGRFYLTIPVSLGVVDYSEYYEITSCEFEKFKSDILLAIPLAEKCRRRENDDNIMIPPPSNRGSAI
ncbi:hypothetical protein [Cedecea lapagei]|uniref:hypothetical protein n=1 Tax=Cedecea lapagei TaxID=158823 RepID=UPI000F8406BF|nr:hypothetical protein [Cedecea lapagei]